MKINLSKLWTSTLIELPSWVHHCNIIYKCTNLINQKCYIGQTSQSLYDRWCSESLMGHKHDIDCDRVLFRAIRKYGADNFEVTILEEDLSVTPYRKLREKYWIKYYHSYIHDPEGPGYNMTKGGDGNEHLREALVKKYPETNGMPTEAREANLRYYPNTNGAPPAWAAAGLQACKEKYGMNGANPKLIEAAHKPDVVKRAQESREKNYYKGLPPELYTEETKAKRNAAVALSMTFRSIRLKINKIIELKLPLNLESYRLVVGETHYQARLDNVIYHFDKLRNDPRWTPEMDQVFSSLIDSDQVNNDSTSTTIEKQ